MLIVVESFAAAAGGVQCVAVFEDSGDVVTGAFNVAVVVAWDCPAEDVAEGASDAAGDGESVEISCFFSL